MQDVNNRRTEYRGAVIWEFSVLSAQFFCKSKTVLEN